MYRRRTTTRYARRYARRRTPGRRYGRSTATRYRRRRRSTVKTRRFSTRKIVNATATKKKDAMTSTIPSSASTPTGSSPVDRDCNFFLFCPTYLPLEEQLKSTHVRNTPDVYFRGHVDNWTLSGGDRFIVTHRHIVFWSNERFNFARPVQSSISTNTFFRRLDQIDPDDGGEGTDFVSLLFQGIRGIDWLSFLNATVDTRRIKLVEDKKRTYRSKDGEALAVRWKSSTFVNRTIRYDDEEVGGGDTDPENPGFSGSPWAVERGGSSGNLYILDLFTSGVDGLPGDPGVDIPVIVHNDAVRYWHEK